MELTNNEKNELLSYFNEKIIKTETLLIILEHLESKIIKNSDKYSFYFTLPLSTPGDETKSLIKELKRKEILFNEEKLNSNTTYYEVKIKEFNKYYEEKKEIQERYKEIVIFLNGGNKELSIKNNQLVRKVKSRLK